VTFAYSPENLRLGKAIAVFTNPDRVVAGVRPASDRDRITALFRPFTERIEWMSVESAEMTKHALNAFLAVSVTFANEIATLCERVGADAKEVERGLKSEARIGPKAYLAPGGAFAGGTLARDVAFLTHIGVTNERPTPLLSAVLTSNDAHRLWVRRTLERLLGVLDGRCVAVWGLTYKPGTDTLRRSESVALCMWLAEHGARVRAHDPAVVTLPDELAREVMLFRTPLEAARGASALVIATEWPEYASLSAENILGVMREPVVVDPNPFLAHNIRGSHATYVAVGSAPWAPP
jgi:UDPglucose 6-dehydrogenase